MLTVAAVAPGRSGRGHCSKRAREGEEGGPTRGRPAGERRIPRTLSRACRHTLRTKGGRSHEATRQRRGGQLMAHTLGASTIYADVFEAGASGGDREGAREHAATVSVVGLGELRLLIPRRRPRGGRFRRGSHLLEPPALACTRLNVLHPFLRTLVRLRWSLQQRHAGRGAQAPLPDIRIPFPRR